MAATYRLASMAFLNMVLLNAAYSPWLFAVSLPIAIHLLTRQAVQVYSLPTFRFLQQSVARQSKIFRIRHLLLLALRALLVALLVTVFLKPARIAPLNNASVSGRRVVIVIDTSLSMGYNRGGVTSLQKAKALADRILLGLDISDRANVILAGAVPSVALSQPSGDAAALRLAVKNLMHTQEKCDVPSAIALAVDQLSKSGHGRAELYLLSDFQRTSWADAKLDSVPGNTQVIFVGAEEGERENTAVTAIRLRPSAPRAGDEITALVEMWNGGPSPRSIPATLWAGDAPPQKQTAVVPPFSSGTVSFPVSFPQPGRYICAAAVPDDALQADNKRWLVVDLQRSLTVYLLTDENASASPNGSYFVSRALNPAPGQPGGIRVIPKRASELTDADLRAADAVVLANVVTMPADRLPAILRYVQRGGALIVFLYGERARAQMEAMNRLAGKGEGKGEGLPFIPTQILDVRGHGKGYVTLSEARYESRLLRVFKDPSSADLGAIKFSRFFQTTEVDGRAETLLKFEDGTPAAARRPLGLGNVLLLNFAPTPRDSDLVKQEVFPPLLHEMLKGIVSGEGERREFSPGGPASVTIAPMPAAERVEAVAPNSRRLPVTVDRVGGGVVIERAATAGVYTILAGGNREAGLVAVNINPDESDLRAINPRELQSRREGRPSYLVGTGENAVQLEDLTRNRSLWPYALVGAFIVLILEQLVSTVGAQSRPAR